MRIGFVGLGGQGGPMAHRIIDAGYPTTLWARRPATLEPFADSNAKVAGSPAELAAAGDLVCVCVVGDADVVDVTTREDGVLAGLAEDAAASPGAVLDAADAALTLLNHPR
jgi:3-hydroxyisobutyrate dehydrogenase